MLEPEDALMVTRLTVDANTRIEKAKSVWCEASTASVLDTLKPVLDQSVPQDIWEARAVAGIHDELGYSTNEYRRASVEAKQVARQYG